MSLILRDVTLNDSATLFLWRNDSACKENSFSNNEIVFDSHNEWLKGKLSDKNTQMYILQDNEVLIGQIRVEFNNNEGLLSYSINSSSRNKGYGIKIIKLLEDKLIKANRKCTLVGYVKKENIASCKIFDKLSYTKEELPDMYKYHKKL